MKVALIFLSTHHGNTKKLAEAIAASHPVTLLDASQPLSVSLDQFDCIGLAAGIAFGNFYQPMLSLMQSSLPQGKDVFFLYTCGTKKPFYTAAAKKIAKSKGCRILGEFGCLGFDTFGPFKLVGGIAKGHPDAADLASAVEFYESIVK